MRVLNASVQPATLVLQTSSAYITLPCQEAPQGILIAQGAFIAVLFLASGKNLIKYSVYVQGSQKVGSWKCNMNYVEQKRCRECERLQV